MYAAKMTIYICNDYIYFFFFYDLKQNINDILHNFKNAHAANNLNCFAHQIYFTFIRVTFHTSRCQSRRCFPQDNISRRIFTHSQPRNAHSYFQHMLSHSSIAHAIKGFSWKRTCSHTDTQIYNPIINSIYIHINLSPFGLSSNIANASHKLATTNCVYYTITLGWQIC